MTDSPAGRGLVLVLLPDCLLVEIFLHLSPADVLAAGLVCRQWQAVARDELLWKALFQRYYAVARDVPRHPGRPGCRPPRLRCSGIGGRTRAGSPGRCPRLALALLLSGWADSLWCRP